MNQQANTGTEQYSGHLRIQGDVNGSSHDPRSERDAFIADESVASLSAFRIAARAKTLPTSAASQKNPDFRR